MLLPIDPNHVRKCVKDRQTCVQIKPVDNSKMTAELINTTRWDLGPEDVMQTDLLPELPPSGNYENIITVVAYPVSNPIAFDTAKLIIDIMTRHAYLPTFLLTDNGSIFVPNVNYELAEVLGITLCHATKKHAQTTGVLR